METAPTSKVRLVSPCQPSNFGVTSMLTMSPARRILVSEGTPWVTTWLTEMQLACL